MMREKKSIQRRRGMTAAETAEIEGVIKSARDALHGAGIPARTPKFPYSLHHELYRVRLRKAGSRLRHAEVAWMLEEWAASREDFALSYAWQAVAGAVARLAPSEKLPDSIKDGIASVSGEGNFEEWAKASL